MTRRTVDVLSPLLSVPEIPPAASHQLRTGPDLAPRTVVPAWVTDPDVIASILAGFVNIPDDLRGTR
ncbi:hypothetical protein ACGFMM_01635 [Streptomyces sp. NPDC048604]|uniref:hypothetical protein n=1 Tax=Streptomyces sp. NPDC048604 TaxID=3365578 RepID=UPI003715E9B3